MKSCLTEYADCTVNEIAEKYIEEKPQVTDIRFHAGVPVSSEQIGLIINIEAQNQFYPGR